MHVPCRTSVTCPSASLQPWGGSIACSQKDPYHKSGTLHRQAGAVFGRLGDSGPGWQHAREEASEGWSLRRVRTWLAGSARRCGRCRTLSSAHGPVRDRDAERHQRLLTPQRAEARPDTAYCCQAERRTSTMWATSCFSCSASPRCCAVSSSAFGCALILATKSTCKLLFRGRRATGRPNFPHASHCLMRG